MKSNGRFAKMNGDDNSLVSFTGETGYDVESNHKMQILSSLSRPVNFTDSISRSVLLKIPANYAARPDSSNIINYQLDVRFQ
jgi:hypothetical protein